MKIGLLRAKEKILGIDNLIKHGLPRLNNVLLVKGLTTNLISISQLCDQGMEVSFSSLDIRLLIRKEKFI